MCLTDFLAGLLHEHVSTFCVANVAVISVDSIFNNAFVCRFGISMCQFSKVFYEHAWSEFRVCCPFQRTLKAFTGCMVVKHPVEIWACQCCPIVRGRAPSEFGLFTDMNLRTLNCVFVWNIGFLLHASCLRMYFISWMMILFLRPLARILGSVGACCFLCVLFSINCGQIGVDRFFHQHVSEIVLMMRHRKLHGHLVSSR